MDGAPATVTAEPPPTPGPPGRPARRRSWFGSAGLLGSAGVAAVAYVDPGNVATNVAAGSRFGYLLVWVVVLASACAVVVQHLSARLGLATGASLPAVLGQRLRRGPRLAYWAQAEVVAMATDLAEVAGGAIALQLLFGVPLVLGGVVVVGVSLALLALRDRRSQAAFERATIGLLLVLAVGFLAGLAFDPPPASSVLAGLAPRLDGVASLAIAAGIFGATVMPHAIYLHSQLVADRHGRPASPVQRRRLVRVLRVDVAVAMGLAGLVNVGLLVLAASALHGGGTALDTIAGAHAAIGAALGAGVAAVFAVGLLASGLASSSVGAYAGAVIMEGLLHRRVPLLAQRLITAVPALVVLASGVEPTAALVASQVVLSFGIPFALVPLVRLTAQAEVMGEEVVSRTTTTCATVIAIGVVGLNAALLVVLFTGAG